MLRAEVVVGGEVGLHLRPITELAKQALRFLSRVTLAAGGQTADCRSVLSVLLLAAEPGTQLRLEVEGPDEAEAYGALCTTFERTGEASVVTGKA